MTKTYDLIIIGAGPAGLTAAIYAARYKLNFLVIGKSLGGVMIKGYEIENFPSHEKISGIEIMQKLEKQAKQLGAEIKYEEVTNIEKKSDVFDITTSKEKYLAKNIILATGIEKGKLNVENEKELTGHGISYCSTCDAGFFKNKSVAVVGGNNSALKSALLLRKYTDKVYIIYRGDKLTADSDLLKEVKKNKISVLLNSQITKVIGKEQLEEIELETNGKKTKMKINGLFVEIGNVPNDKIIKKLKLKWDKDYISVNNKQETNVQGVYAAGDMTNNPLKQIITACGEGAVAANSIYQILKK
jgi:thioredoxin-disulfide reductase